MTDRSVIPVRGVHAFVWDGDRVLLALERVTQCWVLPGGHLEPGESIIEALVRELVEEVGLVAEPHCVERAYSLDLRRPGGPSVVRQERYIVRVWSGEARPDGNEIEQVAWLDVAEAAIRLRETPWCTDAAAYLLGDVPDGSVVVADAVGEL